MRLFRGKRVIGPGFMTAALGLSLGFFFDTSASEKHCSSGPCSYFENGKGYPGTCGSLKTDEKNCYCFKNEDKKLSQKQAGCSKR